VQPANRLRYNAIAKTKKGKQIFQQKSRKLHAWGLMLKDPFSLEAGAGNEARTRDPNLGKVVLYH